MTAILQHSDFAGLVHETFALTVDGAAEPLMAELVEVRELNSQSAPNAERKPFSLQFKLPPGTALGQGMMVIRHERLGETNAFLVPIGADEAGWYMEAIYN